MNAIATVRHPQTNKKERYCSPTSTAKLQITSSTGGYSARSLYESITIKQNTGALSFAPAEIFAILKSIPLAYDPAIPARDSCQSIV